MKTRIFLACLAPIVFSANLPAVISIQAIDDTYVRGGFSSNRDDVIGTAASESAIFVKESNSGNWNTQFERRGYVKFDLSSLNADSSASATFRFVVSDVADTSGSDNGQLDVWALNSGFSGTTDWDGSNLMWQATGGFTNAPAIGNANGGGTPYFTSDATQIADNIAVTTTDVTNMTVFNVNIATLGDFLQVDDTVTIMFQVDPTDNDQEIRIASIEHPTLDGPTLEFTAIPEPSTVAFVMVAVTVAILVRRRRVLAGSDASEAVACSDQSRVNLM